VGDRDSGQSTPWDSCFASVRSEVSSDVSRPSTLQEILPRASTCVLQCNVDGSVRFDRFDRLDRLDPLRDVVSPHFLLLLHTYRMTSGGGMTRR
jgi:hypothetical protein